MAPIDLQKITKVTRALNWKGELTGYRLENTFIPLDERNADARVLSQKIANGECVAVDPEFTRAFPVRDRKGVITGYDTETGFVPADENNALFQILKRALENKRCELAQHDLTDVPIKIRELIFCIPFDRPWPHLVGPFWRSWKYRSNDESHWREFKVTLLNLPTEPDDLFGHIARSLVSTEPVGFGKDRQLIPIKNGLLEIEIAVASLRGLFREERSAGFD